jgi:hypothetical protein
MVGVVARSIRLFLCTLALTFLATAHDIITTNLTFTRDISRIFTRHCVSCHGEGSSIPLATYAEARPWAVAIKEQVLGRSMPPWGAVKGFGDLSPDYGLSQEDILIIAGWVIGGAPEGDPRLLTNQQPKPAVPVEPPVEDGLTVETRTELKGPLKIFGVRPLPHGIVESSRVIARLPDGAVEPLVWLYHFDPKYGRTFTFRKPLEMPKGTVVEASTPLRFALETTAAAAKKGL